MTKNVSVSVIAAHRDFFYVLRHLEVLLTYLHSAH